MSMPSCSTFMDIEFFNFWLLKTSKDSFELFTFFKKDRDSFLMVVFVWLKVLGS